MRVGFVLLFLVGVAACANTPAERNLAATTSAQLVLHEGQVKQFIAAQGALNAADAAELDQINAQAAAYRGAVARQTQAWTLMGDKTHSALLGQAQLMSSVTPPAIVATTAAAPTTAAALTDSGSEAALEGANKTLQSLATAKSGTWDQLKELFGYFASVNSAVSSLQSAAASSPSAGPSKPAATPSKPAT